MTEEAWTPPPLTEWKRDGANVVWIDRDALIIRTIANCMNEDQSKFIVDMAHEREPLLAALRGAVEAIKALRVMGETVKPQKLDDALGWRANDELAQSQADAAILAAEEFLK